MDWGYLKRAEELNILPNFWMSEDYFEMAGFKEVYEMNWRGVHIMVVDDEQLVFPMLPLQNGNPKYDANGVWCCFEKPERDAVFLDYQYIYKPEHFFSGNTTGKKWHLWRKNLNKFYKLLNTPPECMEYKDVLPNLILDLWLKWLKNKPEAIIHDDETMYNFIKSPFTSKAALFRHNEIIGFNIWDENWKYINFRYSFSDPKIPGSSYALRHYFYVNMADKNKLINDGGCLDSKKLEFFKDKLNPVNKYKVYSYKTGEKNDNGH